MPYEDEHGRCKLLEGLESTVFDDRLAVRRKKR